MAEKNINRRTHEDIWSKLLRMCLVPYAYVMAILCLVLVLLGQGVNRSLYWAGYTEAGVRYIFSVMLLSLVFSAVGFVINLRRRRRAFDESQLPILFLGFICSMGLLISLTVFRTL